MLKRRIQSSLAMMASVWLGLGGCVKNSEPPTNGVCSASSDSALACGTYGTGDAAVNTGLVGYSCTGTARPDDSPSYIDGVPQGSVCVNRGVLDDGTQGYCCTSYATTCAFNPVATCSEPSPVYGFQCRGADRPEAYNPLIICGQGINDGDFIDFCCSSNDYWAGDVLGKDSGCIAYGNQKACDNRKMGFLCAGPTLPTEEVLASNKSKADINRLICSTPASNVNNPVQSYYCCYIPALVPEGGSCVQDTLVAGCDSTIDGVFKYGFACYGSDRPEDDYPHIQCEGPGTAGTSVEGYPATLYCCEYP